MDKTTLQALFDLRAELLQALPTVNPRVAEKVRLAGGAASAAADLLKRTVDVRERARAAFDAAESHAKREAAATVTAILAGASAPLAPARAPTASASPPEAAAQKPTLPKPRPAATTQRIETKGAKKSKPPTR